MATPADYIGPTLGEEVVTIKLVEGDPLDLVLNTSETDFRAKVFAGQTVSLGKSLAEHLLQTDPDNWEVVPKSKDRR